MLQNLNLNQIFDVRNKILTLIRIERKTVVAYLLFERNTFSWFESVFPELTSVFRSCKFLARRGPQRNI